MPAQTVIKIRRDTSANWTSADPTLAAGEIAFETDTNKIKVGDGSTAWSSLDYASGAGTAAEITYDNSAAELVATTVKGALDELSLTKANVSDLSTNLNVYATTATSDISGYNVLVSNIGDADYDDVAVNVPTGAITADDQLIASLAAPADLFSGVVGPINVTTIGNIRKTAGNNNAFASFYFEVYKRATNGTETLVGTSDNTEDINPETSEYQEFNATAFTQFGTVLDTDRVVIKYYANLTGGTGAEYDLQFGGSSPVRTLIPVPASVIVAHIAQEVMTDTTNFDGLLSAADTTVQAALETLDDVVIPAGTVASDTAPSSPEVGQMWWDSSDGSLYIYYDGFWVAAVTGITGPAGADGADGVDGVNGVDGVDGVDGGFDSTQTIETVATSRALTSADAGKLILNSAAITITVEGLSVGQQVDFLQNTADQITFAAGAGMTLNSKDGNLLIAAQYSPAGVKCIATNTYVLVGDLGA